MPSFFKSLTFGGLALFGQGQKILRKNDISLQESIAQNPFQNGLLQNLPATYGNQLINSTQTQFPEYQLINSTQTQFPEYQLINSTQTQFPEYQLINSTQNQLLDNFFVRNNWNKVSEESKLNNKPDNKIVKTMGKAYNNGNLWIWKNGQVFLMVLCMII